MTGFEDITLEDITAQLMLLSIMMTKDWNLEYLRSRLTEIYDREFVDKLVPYQ